MSKSFKKTVNIDEVIEAKKGQIETLKHQCYAVELMLALNSDQQYRVRVEKDGLVRKAAHISLQIENVEQALGGDVKYMENMSKTSEDHLRVRQTSLQKALDDVRKDCADLQKKLELLTAKRQADLDKWENVVLEKERAIEEKALEFGLRLKETLIAVKM